jgi:type IV pilus biogenesis/stability protein PilW
MRRILRIIFISFFCAGLVFLGGCPQKKPSVSAAKQKEAQGHYDMAMAYMQNDKGSQALEELEKAKAVNPFDSEIHNALGLVYFSKERFDKAEEAYKKALEVDPKNSDARHNLGALYLYLGRYDEAVNQFNEALADDTYRNQANTLNALGWTYYKLQDYLRAEQYFKEVIDRDRRYFIAYDNLAKVYMATNRIDDAVAQLAKVLEITPLYPEANLDLGICFLKKGEKAKAREHFMKVLQTDPLGKLGNQAQEYLNILD